MPKTMPVMLSVECDEVVAVAWVVVEFWASDMRCCRVASGVGRLKWVLKAMDMDIHRPGLFDTCLH